MEQPRSINLDELKKAVAEPNSTVNRWIDSTLDYATSIQVDPVWFLDETLGMLEVSIYNRKYGFSSEELKLLTDPKRPPRYSWEFYELAIEAISRDDRETALERLRQAEEDDRQDNNRQPLFRWAQENLLSLLDSLNADPDTALYDLDVMKFKLSQFRFRNLLATESYCHSEEYLALESGQVIKIKKECEEKTQPLKDQIKELENKRDVIIAEIQRPRSTSEKMLLDNLKANLKVGCDRSFGSMDYWSPGTTFGFDEQDAILMLQFALEKEIDPAIFLSHCETTRKSLEYHWDTHRDTHRVTESLFTDSDKRKIPTLGDVDKIYNEGVELLFAPLASNSNYINTIENTKEHFVKARELYESIDDPRISITYSQATSAFFEFMTTEKAIVFAVPTSRKFRYETRSFKEK